MWKWEMIASRVGMRYIHMNSDCRDWSRSRLCNRGGSVQISVTTQTPRSDNGHENHTNMDLAIDYGQVETMYM